MIELITDINRTAAEVVFLTASVVGASAFAVHKLRVRKIKRQLQEYAAAIDNMAQGICMFDKNKKMVFCNRRYLEMYGLKADDVMPGVTVDCIVDLRYQAGSNPKLGREEYLKWRSSLADAEKQRGTIVELANGKITEIRQENSSDGGYVATHEDITLRQVAEREQATTQEQARRRAAIDAAIASFQVAVTTNLKDLGNDAAALKATAIALSSTSKQMSQVSATAVEISDKGSHSAEAASGSAEELSYSISNVSQQLNETARLIAGSVQEARHADTEISDLAQSAEQIGDVVKLIQKIATQTNLLALNATIEAARAGAVGKGFAVVAAEVKQLAVQTAQATNEVARHITLVRNSAQTAISAIHGNATRLHEVGEHASSVAKALDEQSAATTDILSNVAAASNGVQEIRTTLKEVDQSAHETRDAANEVLAASQRVEEIAGQLREKITGFLEQAAA